MKKVAGGDICPPTAGCCDGTSVGKETKPGTFQPSLPSWKNDTAGKGELSCIQMPVQYGKPYAVLYQY